jgi:hypothetical protein
MAVFVDLGDEDNDPPQDGQPVWTGPVDPVKPVPVPVAAASGSLPADGIRPGDTGKQHEAAPGLAVRESLNNNSMTQALGCYP